MADPATFAVFWCSTREECFWYGVSSCKMQRTVIFLFSYQLRDLQMYLLVSWKYTPELFPPYGKLKEWKHSLTLSHIFPNFCVQIKNFQFLLNNLSVFSVCNFFVNANTDDFWWGGDYIVTVSVVNIGTSLSDVNKL